MATGIMLLLSLLLLVPKGYCIETFGLAGQHVVPSDISVWRKLSIKKCQSGDECKYKEIENLEQLPSKSNNDVATDTPNKSEMLRNITRLESADTHSRQRKYPR